MSTLFTRFTAVRSITCLMLVFVFSQVGMAQDLNSLMSDANKAWKEKDYARSQAIFTRIVDAYGPRAAVLFGPKFGSIYYRKGLTELKLAHEASKAGRKEESKKWYAKAAKSFQTCYEKFPNNAQGIPNTINTSQNTSLERRAEASMGMGQYEKSIE